MPKGNCDIPKTCNSCNENYLAKVGNQKFCGIKCKRSWARNFGSETTERQYKLISGDWKKYFNRLCCRSFKRDQLNVDTLLRIKDRQNGRCALSGVEMTCYLQKGTVSKTNASIDRINPKGLYTEDNIQLVCAVINKFRVDTPVDEFIDWCRKVASNAVCK